MVEALILKLVEAILALLLVSQPEFTVYEDGSGTLQDGSTFCIEDTFCTEQPGDVPAPSGAVPRFIEAFPMVAICDDANECIVVQSAKFFGEAP